VLFLKKLIESARFGPVMGRFYPRRVAVQAIGYVSPEQKTARRPRYAKTTSTSSTPSAGRALLMMVALRPTWSAESRARGEPVQSAESRRHRLPRPAGKEDRWRTRTGRVRALMQSPTACPWSDPCAERIELGVAHPAAPGERG
jgi:hypothetical protein